MSFINTIIAKQKKGKGCRCIGSHDPIVLQQFQVNLDLTNDKIVNLFMIVENFFNIAGTIINSVCVMVGPYNNAQLSHGGLYYYIRYATGDNGTSTLLAFVCNFNFNTIHL